MATYRISQLAERAGLRPTTLRFYEQAGLLPARRSNSGYRLYDDHALERLTFITAAKTLGLPLAEIRDLLGVWAEGLCTDVRVRLRPMLTARIAQAEQRAAELATCTDRLRQTLTEIDGPPRPGRCEPACLHHDAPELPIACTLTGDEQADRIQHWRRLLATATGREPIDNGIRIDLPADLAAEIADLAVAEQRCCAFFDFTLHLAGRTVRLDVRAPAEAASLLADVFGD